MSGDPGARPFRGAWGEEGAEGSCCRASRGPVCAGYLPSDRGWAGTRGPRGGCHGFRRLGEVSW